MKVGPWVTNPTDAVIEHSSVAGTRGPRSAYTGAPIGFGYSYQRVFAALIASVASELPTHSDDTGQVRRRKLDLLPIGLAGSECVTSAAERDH